MGPETTIEGALCSQGAVRVDGKITGGISAQELIIGERGQVEGDVQATSVVIAGKITGNVTCEESLELRSSAQVQGDIHAPTLHIDEGATFEGQCLMNELPRAELVVPSSQG